MQNGNRYTHLLTVATAIFWHATTGRSHLKSLAGLKIPSSLFSIHEFSCAIMLGLQTGPLYISILKETFTKAEIGFMPF